MKYMEYTELQTPDDVQTRLEKMREIGDPKSPATLGAAGFFEWVTKLSREEGWRPVWQGFNFPYLVFEREVDKPREVLHSNPEEEIEK
ncbi:MAG: hypothetical protein ACXABY_01980 [Candidatus Thorarchaeota archaeon]|jgi:hypothetical protein